MPLHDETQGLQELVADPGGVRSPEHPAMGQTDLFIIGDRCQSGDVSHARGNGLWTEQEHRREGAAVSPTDGTSRLMANPHSSQQIRDGVPKRVQERHPDTSSPGWWDTEPAVGRVADGVDYWSHRLKAIGNGQVSGVAALAFKTLLKRARGKILDV